MSNDPVVRLRKLREEGVGILIALIEATPETVATVCAQEGDWCPRLVEAVEPFGALVAARFEPISPMKLEESASIHAVPSLSFEHFDSMHLAGKKEGGR